MTKKNDTKSKKMADQPVPDVQGLPAGEEVTTTPITQDAPVTEEKPAEIGEKELQVLPGEDSGEQADGKKSTELDSSNEDQAAGNKGRNAKDKVNDKRERIAADVFRNNPRSNELHFSSDMIPFFLRSDAVRHASTLKDETIVTINRK